MYSYLIEHLVDASWAGMGEMNESTKELL